ncbi:MAG: hypothetical protein GMKNLPBB_02161 [Myxococcota bacterium]|nr:hypothetical protein [Myxococcota bacterium]
MKITIIRDEHGEASANLVSLHRSKMNMGRKHVASLRRSKMNGGKREERDPAPAKGAL